MGVCDPFRQNLKRQIIDNTFDRLTTLEGDYWFIGIGKVDSWVNTSGVTADNSPPRGQDTIREDINFWRKLIALKRIYPENVSLVVRRYDWEKGTVYDAYRDDVDLFDDINPAKFYVLVDEERVYKCIDNNHGAVSSVAPTHTDYEIRELSDGYRWKFLYQIPESKRKFLIQAVGDKPGYMPVEYIEYLQENDERTLQWNVQENAVVGAIDFVEIDSNLRTKFVSSNRVLFPSDANQFVASTTAGSSTVYLGGSYLVPQNNFYNGMILKVDSGMGSGQQRIVDSYTYNSNGTATVTLHDPLNFTITGGTSTDSSRYSILPRVYVEGDGEANNNSLNTYIDRADFTLKFETESIYGTVTGPRYLSSVEAVDTGKNYSYAALTITGFGFDVVSGATGDLTRMLNPIIAPFDGHGSNPVKELGASCILVVLDFSGSENEKISVLNDIRQFGIIHNPLLTDKHVYLTLKQPGVNGSFVDGATVSQGFTGSDGTTGYDLCSGVVYDWTPGVSGMTGSARLHLSEISGGDFELNGKIGTFEIVDVVERTFAGSEYQNLTDLTLVPLGTAGTSFSADGTDYTPGFYAFGAGFTSEKIVPSRSVGRIYSWEPSVGSNLAGSLRLEDASQTWKLGEKVSQFNYDMSYFSGLNGKITEISHTYDNQQTTYDLTTKLTVSWNGVNTFTNLSFEKDERVFGPSGSATVVQWVNATGSTAGTITLIDVAGTFAENHYIQYKESSGTSGARISSVNSFSEIQYNSGEVQFIQNIRPIDRSDDQREEIKFLIEI